ncbi:hypothetical protein ACSNOK_05455 [Streptomyces sp. URMC 126]|uniref:hypothetical protein n=1 Tax=Streptomyces sp. URMC 126 TaxID=3423401 RepID=UPI003F1D6599
MLDETSIHLARLPDPYEPLFVLYERGGEFSVEHGHAAFLPWRLPLESRDRYLSRDPVVALDEAVLDAIDAERRF